MFAVLENVFTLNAKIHKENVNRDGRVNKELITKLQNVDLTETKKKKKKTCR